MLKIGSTNKFNNFIQSEKFIVLFSGFIFIMSLFNISAITLSITALVLALIFITQKNLKPIFVPFSLIYFGIYTIDGKYNLNWFFFTSMSLLVLSIIFYCIKNKPKLKPSFSFKGLLIYAIAYPLGGILSSRFGTEYPFTSNLALLGVAFFGMLLFLFLSNVIEIDNPDYIIKLFIGAGTIIFLQLTYRLIFIEGFIELIKNDRVILNWGVYNGVVTSFLFAIPACFYFSIKENNYNFIYLILMNLFTMSSFLIGSRAGMIGLTLEVIILDISACIFAKNKKPIKVSVIIIFIIYITSFITIYFLFSEFFNVLFESFIKSGINISSRLKIWDMSRIFFLENPLFGVGLFHNFYDPIGVTNFLWLSHNTFLQALSSLGLFGFFGIIIHLFCKYKVCLYKTPFHMISLIMFIGTDLYGLIDCTYPAPYMIIPLFILLISLDIVNKNAPSNIKKDDLFLK